MSGTRAETAARTLGLIDLTDLSDTSSDDAVRSLAARGQNKHGNVATLCIWPRFVKTAKSALGQSGIRVATVVNFPAGGTDVAATLEETRLALDDGADEIDLVLPYRALLSGDVDTASEMVAAIAAETTSRNALLKVIVETGEMKVSDAIEAASRLAIDNGADFIKTSTGKVSVNATLEAARIMLSVIAATDRAIGFKPAGGIRTVEDAGAYLAIADEVLGPDWVSAETFRFGASGVLDDVLAALDGGVAATGAGY